MDNQDEKYMRECFKLAQKGKGSVSPNPMVGCVVLNRYGEVISTGYHHKYGENHAERDALLKLSNNEAVGGSLYVNLEPCSHFGKTPPCTDLIIEKGIKKVIIGMRDVNPKVNGIDKLRQQGIEVVTDVLREEAEFLNRVFIKNMTQKLPYVVLKTATTMDGKIAAQNGDSKWITSEKSRREVYRIRKEFDCILTSSNTVIADNPRMEHSFKCILDTNARTTKSANIFSQGECYVATKNNTPLKGNKLDLKAVLETLYSKGKYSILAECGGTLAGALLKEGLVDEIYQFIAPKITNDNNSISCFNGDSIFNISQSINLKIYDVNFINPDILVRSCVINT